MITAVIRTLMDYLGDCGLPLYLADCVPQGLSFPYLTAEVTAPFTQAGRGEFTLTLWCSGSIANLARMTLHDSLMQYFPARGLCLEMDEGRAIIRPGGAAKCVQDGEARGISTRMDVRVFPHA